MKVNYDASTDTLTVILGDRWRDALKEKQSTLDQKDRSARPMMSTTAHQEGACPLRVDR